MDVTIKYGPSSAPLVLATANTAGQIVRFGDGALARVVDSIGRFRASARTPIDRQQCEFRQSFIVETQHASLTAARLWLFAHVKALYDTPAGDLVFNWLNLTPGTITVGNAVLTGVTWAPITVRTIVNYSFIGGALT